MDKWVLWAGGMHHWSTASDNYHQAMRLALKHFGVPETELFKDDKIVSNRWMAFIKDRHDGACLLQASPQRGIGKTVPNEWHEVKGDGFDNGSFARIIIDGKRYSAQEVAKTFLASLPKKSDYVTRDSAERAVRAALNKWDNPTLGRWTGPEYFLDMLEDKPRERVKAR